MSKLAHHLQEDVMSIMDYYVAAYHDEEFKARFESFIQVGNIPSIDCWRWLGSRYTAGYAWISYKRKTLTAHRFMYMLTTDHYPHDLDVHHTCRNKWCVSPYHLEAMTRAEHKFKGHKTTQCKRGHIRDSENTYVTPAGVRGCKICANQRQKERRQSKRR